MHIPPLYKRTSWQRFLIGIVVGCVLAYLLLLFMHGTMYEQVIQENSRLRATNKELTNFNNSLIADKEEAEEQEKKPYTIQRIHIAIENEKQLRLDRLATHQLKELITDEIDLIIGKSVQSTAENNELLIAAIENKTFKIDDFSYSLEVTKFILYSTVHITVRVTLET